MVKIYVHNKPLFLVDSITSEVKEYVKRKDTLFIDDLNSSSVKTMIQQLEQADFYAGVFLHPKLDELLEAFKSKFIVIQAAGGLVHIKRKDILLIFRKGKWDLPKGKLDDGEEMESCALREIKEETGVDNLQIEKPLQITYHTYHEGEKHILKESHWFLIKANNRSSLTPQTEEDIEKCEWASLEDLSTYTSNMHASIIDVTNTALKLLKKKIVKRRRRSC